METLKKGEEVFLLKFGKERDILDLYENGTVFCKRLQYFTTLEDEQVRGDINETFKTVTFKQEEITSFQIEINGEREPIKLIPQSDFVLTSGNSFRNIYCMTGVTLRSYDQNGTFNLSDELKRFGAHYLFFVNSLEFRNRVSAALVKRNLEFSFEVITYYPAEKFKANITGFQKLNIFNWQQEVRFMITNSRDEDLKLNIGSVKDIAQIFDTSNFLEKKPSRV
jgi:hypothetical protein